MATPIRRLNPANAAARGASRVAPTSTPTPVKRRTEEAARGFVSTEAKDRDGPYHKEDKEIELLRTTFEEGQQPAFVKVGAGLTINQGNFESLRIDCSVTIPCLPHEIQDAYEIASNFVVEKIAEEEMIWQGQNQKAPAKATSKKR